MKARERQATPFSGDYEALVRTARLIMRLTHDARRAAPSLRAAYEKAGHINERLVRQYVAAGVVSPGERRGREVCFGARQLLELVVTRHLIAVERWKLPQIARLMRTADAQMLRDLLPSRAADAHFATAEREVDWPVVADDADYETPMAVRAPSAPGAVPLHSLVAESRVTAEFARDRERLREPLVPAATQWFRFRLTDWTEVHVREDALEAWDDALVQALAENLKAMLRQVVAARSGGRRRG